MRVLPALNQFAAAKRKTERYRALFPVCDVDQNFQNHTDASRLIINLPININGLSNCMNHFEFQEIFMIISNYKYMNRSLSYNSTQLYLHYFKVKRFMIA